MCPMILAKVSAVMPPSSIIHENSTANQYWNHRNLSTLQLTFEFDDCCCMLPPCNGLHKTYKVNLSGIWSIAWKPVPNLQKLMALPIKIFMYEQLTHLSTKWIRVVINLKYNPVNEAIAIWLKLLKSLIQQKYIRFWHCINKDDQWAHKPRR